MASTDFWADEDFASRNQVPICILPGTFTLEGEPVKTNDTINAYASVGTVVHIGSTAYVIGFYSNTGSSMLITADGLMVALPDKYQIKLKANTPLRQLETKVCFVLSVDADAHIQVKALSAIAKSISVAEPYIITRSYSHVKFFSVHTYKECRSVFLSSFKSIQRHALSADMKLICLRDRERIRVFRTSDFKVTFQIDDNNYYRKGLILRFSPNNKLIFACSRYGIDTFDISASHKSKFADVPFSNYLDMAVGTDQSVYILRPLPGAKSQIMICNSLGQQINELNIAFDMTAMCLSPDNEKIILGSRDGSLRTIQISTGCLSLPMQLETNRIKTMFFIGLNQYLICKSKDHIIVIQTSDFTVYRRFEQNPVRVYDQS